MFVLTFSLSIATLQVFHADAGEPGISELPGQFPMKEFVLLTDSFCMLIDSLKAIDC